jgi:NAD(P)-dependent dehydrogenase (short-subunit alcohol dehydrogenase family)
LAWLACGQRSRAFVLARNTRREEWEHTFKTNIDAYFHLVQSALPYLKPGSTIIATSSQVGLIGSESLPDYSATKGAINAFTKTLAQMLVDRGIRVNAVAPAYVFLASEADSSDITGIVLPETGGLPMAG